MIKNKIILLVLMILLIGSFLIMKNKFIGNDTKKEVNQKNIVIYPNAYDVRPIVTENRFSKGITYYVNLRYPEKSVFFLYDKELKKIGFEEINPLSIDNDSLRKWKTIYFEDKGLTNQPFQSNLYACWLNKKTREIAYLLLFYKWDYSSGFSEQNKVNNRQGIWFEMTSIEKSISLDNIDLKIIYPEKYLLADESHTNGNEQKTFEITELLIYPNAEHIQYFQPQQKMLGKVFYLVWLNYPSKKVLDFYKNELDKKGFKPLILKTPPYNVIDWQFSKMGESKYLNYVQLNAFWINVEKNLIAQLTLYYRWNKIDNIDGFEYENNKEQSVFFQIARYDSIKDEDLKNIDPGKYFQ